MVRLPSFRRTFRLGLRLNINGLAYQAFCRWRVGTPLAGWSADFHFNGMLMVIIKERNGHSRQFLPIEFEQVIAG